MAPENEEIQDERHFLHDLCNPLAIAYGSLRLIKMKMETPDQTLEQEELETRLNKALVNFERVNKLIDARRNVLKNTPLPPLTSS